VSEPTEKPAGDITLLEAVRPAGKAMSFWGHLNELRGVLFRCAVSFVIAGIVVAVYDDQFYDVLSWPLNHVRADYPNLAVDLGINSPMAAFNVYMQFCIVGGLIIASPLILFFVGQFISPALTERERRTVLPFAGSALVLFLSGCTFSFFFLVTSALRVSIELMMHFHWDPRWTVDSYFGLVTWLVLGVGLSFEFPLVIIVLIHFGLLSTAFLLKYWKHAIVCIFILSAVVTPTSDFVTQSIFAAPLIVLYWVAIIAGRRIEKRRAARLAAGEL
jgi:sec-independent protein translocase protein TatC